MSDESSKMTKYIEFAKTHLLEDEIIIHKVLGRYDGSISGKHILSRGIILTTNKRLIFCNKKNMASFNYDNIYELDYSKSLVNGSTITFKYYNNIIRLINLDKHTEITQLFDFLNNPKHDKETDFNHLFKESEVKPNIKQIKETKCTCGACGKVWFYGKEEKMGNTGEKIENFGNSMSNTGKDMMCCGGCLPALFIPEKNVKKVNDLNKCPECGSKAVKKEEVVHNVE